MANDSFDRHLLPYKTLRDPVQGDIVLTKLETRIIDTPAFQRLHSIKQLGCAYLVYPGATHTRFSHSIGTLHSAQLLIDSMKRRESSSDRLDSYAILLVRLSALIHDLAHVPFGHTLEDEGSLFPSQWHDDFRVDYFLGANSEVGRIISEQVGENCLDEVTKILRADNETIGQLRYPFAADVIGDTFCADYLDYSRRDSYYVGLRDLIDLRLVNYMGVSRLDGRAILELGTRSGQARRDLVSDLVDLIRVRYHIMESTIYHHTKVEADAMIIDAVYDMLVEGKLTMSVLCQVGDDTLLDLMERDGTPQSKRLIGKLRRREFYDPVYAISCMPAIHETEAKRRELFEHYATPEKRRELSRLLESAIGLERGSVVVYCPKIKGSRKSSSLMISLGNEIFPLSEIPDTSIREEIALIEDRYQLLPKFLVLADSGILAPKKEKIASVCRSLTSLSSELT
jgi:HD superfamily phosphohydrolase